MTLTVLSGAQPPLRVLLVDDEPLARARLRTLLADCNDPPTIIAGEAGDAAAALAQLDQDVIDLVLLDVAMPGLDGTQLAAELGQRPQAPVVIFVTAHSEHAVKAFELNAIDYLTKPVRAERLQAALHKVEQRRSTASLNRAQEPVLLVSDRGRVQRVPVSQALYFKAELKYVTLRTVQRTHVLDESLSDLTHRLGADFIRIHRNALVARAALRELGRRIMVVEGDDVPVETWAVRVAPLDEWLAVSRRQLALVREALEAGRV